MKLPLKRSNKLIEQAIEQNQEKEYYDFWLVRYPLYDEHNYESFEEFYEKYSPDKEVVCNQNKDELMSEIVQITPTERRD